MRNDEYLRHLIPRLVEQKLDFMLQSVPQEGYLFYLKWFIDSLKIEYARDSETMLVDIVRHLVVNVFTDERLRGLNILQRYVLIAGIINSQKNELQIGLVLQAVYIDWLFFDE